MGVYAATASRGNERLAARTAPALLKIENGSIEWLRALRGVTTDDANWRVETLLSDMLIGCHAPFQRSEVGKGRHDACDC